LGAGSAVIPCDSQVFRNMIPLPCMKLHNTSTS
jgi:hypothetical protein